MKKMLLNMAAITMLCWVNTTNASSNLLKDDTSNINDTQNTGINVHNSFSDFESLPAEIQSLIYQKMSFKDLASSAQTNKQAHQLISSISETSWASAVYKLNNNIGSDPRFNLVKSILNGTAILRILPDTCIDIYTMGVRKSVEDNGDLVMQEFPIVPIYRLMNNGFLVEYFSPDGKIGAGYGYIKNIKNNEPDKKCVFIADDKDNLKFLKHPDNMVIRDIIGVSNSGGVVGLMEDKDNNNNSSLGIGFYGDVHHNIIPIIDPLKKQFSGPWGISANGKTIFGNSYISSKSVNIEIIPGVLHTANVAEWSATMWIAGICFDINDLLAKSGYIKTKCDRFISIFGISENDRAIFGLGQSGYEPLMWSIHIPD